MRLLRKEILLGAPLGLAVGIFALGAINRAAAPVAVTGPIISECDGAMRELVIQYEPSAREVVRDVYPAFLGALGSNVLVHVVCPDQAAFDDLKSLVGTTRSRLAPILVHHPMTTWARDRWVALAPAAPSAATTLLSPRGESGDDIWPARAGDEKIGGDIAAALAPGVKALRSELLFDGGDFMADGENVFVAARVVPRNLQQTVRDEAELRLELDRQLKRNVILLDKSPDHHIGMFMVSIGHRTVLVGDPAWGQKLLPPDFDTAARLPGGADFTPATQELFDAVARQCAAAGYRVLRVPVVPALDRKSYLTFVNVLLDTENGRRVVYLPHYAGADPLNATARSIWEGLGFEVRPIDCTATYRRYGCLHCLVNVIRRG
jgi:hypothetical protein